MLRCNADTMTERSASFQSFSRSRDPGQVFEHWIGRQAARSDRSFVPGSVTIAPQSHAQIQRALPRSSFAALPITKSRSKLSPK